MDELILRRAQKGDHAAFEQLITPHEGMIWRVCWRYTRNHEDASDCAQDAMLKAWRSLPLYRSDCALESWLYRICISCCMDFLRRKRGEGDVSLSELSEVGYDPPSASPTPEESTLKKEAGQELQQAIDQLPEDMRTVLILSALEDKKYEDIAVITGVAVGTVKSRLNRARVKLAQILAGKREPSARISVLHDERRTI